MSVELQVEAPDFTLQDTEGKEVSLSNFQGSHNVVLFFFPLAFSGVCTKELCTVRDNMKFYNAFDAKVIGISVDSFFTLREFKKAQNLNFTLLSDFNKKASKSYDALYEEYYGMKGVSKRASFVIDKQGTIRHLEILEDSGELPNFKAIQRTIDQLS